MVLFKQHEEIALETPVLLNKQEEIALKTPVLGCFNAGLLNCESSLYWPNSLRIENKFVKTHLKK